MGPERVAVEQVKEARLDLPDDAEYARVEIPEQEQHPVRRVLEHRPGVFGIEQRAQSVDRLLDRSLEEPQLEGDLARLAGHVLAGPLSLFIPMNSNNSPSLMAPSEDRG